MKSRPKVVCQKTDGPKAQNESQKKEEEDFVAKEGLGGDLHQIGDQGRT